MILNTAIEAHEILKLILYLYIEDFDLRYCISSSMENLNSKVVVLELLCIDDSQALYPGMGKNILVLIPYGPHGGRFSWFVFVRIRIEYGSISIPILKILTDLEA